MKKRKIISADEKVGIHFLKMDSYEEVERGERKMPIGALDDGTIPEKEVDVEFSSFDEDIALGKAVLIGEYTDKNGKKVIAEPESLPDPEPEEPEPEEPKAPTKEEIEAMIIEAREKAYADGFEKGKAEGLAEGTRKYEAQRQDYIESLQCCHGDVRAHKDKFIEAINEIDNSLPELVNYFVTEIIGTERRVNENLVKSVIKKIFHKLKDFSNVTFKVNPQDADIIREAHADADIIVDQAVERGGLKVMTNIGELDYTLENMLEEFRKHLNEELEST